MKINKLFIYLILASTFATCLNSVKADDLRISHDYLIKTSHNNVIFNNSKTLSFSSISIGSHTITFNSTTSINVTCASPITIEMEYLAPSTTVMSENYVMKFNASTSAATASFNITGFNPSQSYKLYVDNIYDRALISSPTGYLNFSYTHFSKHSFSIFPGTANYTFMVRYENYSQGLVNLSRWGPHQIIVVYDEKREENWFQDRNFIHNESNFSAYDFYNGSFNLSLNTTNMPLWIEFHWNDTMGSSSSIVTTERFYGYPKMQNTTYTYIQLAHIPISFDSINVTCYNSTIPKSESYPNFLLSGSTITINPYQADTFNQINVTYSYVVSYSPFRCNRVQVVNGFQTNITFYIFTNKRVYGENTNYFNNSLIKYTYDFEDKTGIFARAPDIDTFAYIYTYTENGTRMMIHSEFWDTSDKIYPWLLYDKEYFIGVSCSALTIDRVGIAPATTNVNPVITIDYPTVNYYSLGAIILWNAGWMNSATGCYVRYQDTVHSMQYVTMRLYNFSNGSLAHQAASTAEINNFTYPTACQHDSYYYILTFNHSFWAKNQTVSGIIYAKRNGTFNSSWLDQILNLTFGETPFRNLDTGQEIPWIYIGIFAGFFIFLVSFAIINAYGAVAISGIWLMFCGVFFHNLPQVGTLGSVSLVACGAFLTILAILAALGGYGNR